MYFIFLHFDLFAAEAQNSSTTGVETSAMHDAFKSK
jgi:hypothetical protein